VQCYYPYMLFSKKRYAGLMFTKPDGPDYIDVKGLQLVRRDNCPLVKEVSATILDRIMYERSKERAVEAARDAVMRVLRHEEPLAKFVVSKALRSDYKNLAQVSHGEGGGGGQGFRGSSVHELILLQRYVGARVRFVVSRLQTCPVFEHVFRFPVVALEF
jgi:hypothetical protein